MKDTRLTDTILRKKFNTKALGYCAEEVDAFLDEINIEIEKLEREVEHLKRELSTQQTLTNMHANKSKELNIELCNLKAQNGVSSTTTANFANIQLLDRIGNLEKMVQKLLDNNKSKDGRF